MPTLDTFAPSTYSLEELRFLREHLGQPAHVVLRQLPPGVNRFAIEPLLTTVQQLEEAKEPWVGLEALKAAIDRYLAAFEQSQELARRGGPKLPSFYAWDSRGRPHRGGVGSDSGRVRTAFAPDGSRVPLDVPLRPPAVPFAVPWGRTPQREPTTLIEDPDKGRFECPICAFTQSFDPDIHAQRNAAWARMRQHLLTAKKDVDAHRALYRHVAESGGPEGAPPS